MTENFLSQLLAVASIHLLAVMSPGPDFLLILKQSLLDSRKSALWASLGLACGIVVHVSYCLAGLGLIISQSLVVFSILKYLGAAYLIWIGWKCLRSTKNDSTEEALLAAQQEKTCHPEVSSSYESFRLGFLTNVLNPKATLFFFALFTQVIDASTPLLEKGIFAVEMVVATFLWFSFAAYLLGTPRIRLAFTNYQHRLEQFFGVLLVALGIRVALAENR